MLKIHIFIIPYSNYAQTLHSNLLSWWHGILGILYNDIYPYTVIILYLGGLCPPQGWIYHCLLVLRYNTGLSRYCNTSSFWVNNWLGGLSKVSQLISSRARSPNFKTGIYVTEIINHPFPSYIVKFFVKRVCVLCIFISSEAPSSTVIFLFKITQLKWFANTSLGKV